MVCKLENIQQSKQVVQFRKKTELEELKSYEVNKNNLTKLIQKQLI